MLYESKYLVNFLCDLKVFKNEKNWHRNRIIQEIVNYIFQVLIRKDTNQNAN